MSLDRCPCRTAGKEKPRGCATLLDERRALDSFRRPCSVLDHTLRMVTEGSWHRSVQKRAGGNMETVDELMLALQQALEGSREWLSQVDALQSQHERSLLPTEGLDEDLRDLGHLRTRASSSLLTLAFLGEFSSGKSFLVSGLQKHLHLERLRVKGNLVDKYVGLLPASPKPTSSCPARVIPISAEPDTPSAPSLRVKFTDAEAWEDKGVADTPHKVAAYATELPELMLNRSPADRQRQVAEIEILVPDYVLPAQLYDLPGINSPSRVHDAIVTERMRDADCFVYVARATDTLSESALELIRFLYQHHKTSGKRVIWVVTAIDLASDLGLDDEPKWKSAAEQNTLYLRESFKTDDDQPDLDFIGQGFIAVSPALEARSSYPHLNDADFAAELAAESRMSELRRLLTQIIEVDTGRKHADVVAGEAYVIVQRHRAALLGALATERIPVDRIKDELDHIRDRVRVLDAEAGSLRSRLTENLRHSINEALSAFDEAGLSRQLHAALDEEIGSANLRREQVMNRIEVRKTQVVKEWLSARGGLQQSWDAAFEEFKEDTLSSLRELIGSPGLPGIWESEALSMDMLSLPKPEQTNAEAEDLVRKATHVAGTIVPLVGIGTVVLGSTAAIFAAPVVVPIGAAITLGGLYAFMRDRKRKISVLEVMRQVEIDNLNSIPGESKEWFALSASVAGQMIIDRADEILDDHRRQLNASLRRLQRRLAEPETMERREFVEKLEAICSAGAAVETALARCRS
jgi:Dynamin family